MNQPPTTPGSTRPGAASARQPGQPAGTANAVGSAGDQRMGPHVVLIDNRDSFVYNLVDAFAVEGYRCTVFRNTVGIQQVLDAQPDLICLSPGPGHPRDAGCMMELLDACLGKVPILGICLGFQAILEHFGGDVRPCGPVHGTTTPMVLTEAGLASPIFAGLTSDDGPENHFRGTKVPIARYHSLGCTNTPAEFVALGHCPTPVGEVVMAATTADGLAVGLQFHPESVLSPSGPTILTRSIDALIAAAGLRRKANTAAGAATPAPDLPTATTTPTEAS